MFAFRERVCYTDGRNCKAMAAPRRGPAGAEGAENQDSASVYLAGGIGGCNETLVEVCKA